MSVEVQVTAIEAMSAKQRKAEWHRRVGTVAPPAFGSGLMARALAYELQAAALGRLGKTEVKRLGASAEPSNARSSASALKPGTWLSRTWHGEVHQVVVLESGFEYHSQRYASLSEVARRITGAHWSGPRFFGLQSPRLGLLGVAADAD